MYCAFVIYISLKLDAHDIMNNVVSSLILFAASSNFFQYHHTMSVRKFRINWLKQGEDPLNNRDDLHRVVSAADEDAETDTDGRFHREDSHRRRATESSLPWVSSLVNSLNDTATVFGIREAG